AVDADEAVRIEPPGDAADGAAQRIVVAAHAQVDVVARGLQPLDVVGGDQEFAPQLAHQEALGAVHRVQRRALVRGAEQAGLALHAPQQQAVGLDHQHDAGVGAYVLEVFVQQLARPRPEFVVHALPAVREHAQGHHPQHVHQRYRHAGRHVQRQALQQVVPVGGPARGQARDQRDQQHPHQPAAGLPDRRLPALERVVVVARVLHEGGDGVAHSVGDQDRGDAAGLGPASPGRIAFVRGRGRGHGYGFYVQRACRPSRTARDSSLRRVGPSLRALHAPPRRQGLAPRSPSADAMTRRHDLDWIRMLAFALLVLYHVGMYYVTWEWHVDSPHAGPALEPLMMLSSPWRLSLLFLVSGAATAFLLGKLRREAAASGTRPRFLGPRSWRLLVPLAFGMLVI